MKELKFFLPVALLCFLTTLTGCFPTYLPNAVNTPLFSEKGEIEADVHASLNGWNVQGGYAVTDHVGVIANAQFNRGRVSGLDSLGVSSEELFKHYFVEGGAGYYGKIGSIGRYGAYGGFGGGSTSSWDAFFLSDNTFDTEYIQADYLRSFITPEIGMATPYFDMSFAPRFSYVNFLNTKRISDGAISANSYSNLFLEPVLMLRGGYKWVKLSTQLGASVPLLAKNDVRQAFNVQPFIWTIGLHINIRSFD